MANLSDEPFPAVDVNNVLAPGSKKTLVVDPVSATIENEERIKAVKQQEEKETNDALRQLKSTIIVSAIAVAVVGAIYAITRKLREK